VEKVFRQFSERKITKQLPLLGEAVPQGTKDQKPHPSLYRLRGKTTPSPYTDDLQIFCESGGEGLKAQN